MTTNNSTQFTVPSIGAVLDYGDFTLGFTINTLANFNTNMSAMSDYELFNSKARMWVDQLEGIPSSSLDGNFLFNGVNPMQWDAVMGYDSFLIDPAGQGADFYTLNGIIDANDAIGSYISKQTTGSVNETAFSGGYNFNDKLYIGATLGFQWLHYEEYSIYEEEMLIDGAEVGTFDYFTLNDQVALDASGFNMKFGAILRPIPQLRIGISYHTPTWMTVEEISYSEMRPYFTVGDGRFSYTPDLVQSYDMQTPSRLLVGASATLLGAMIVSFDYELVDYSQMLYTTNINTSGWREGTLSNDIDNLPTYANATSSRGDIGLNGVIRNYYGSTNSYKLGVEIQPAPGFFLRGGYSYTDSPYADVQSYYDPTMLMSDFGAVTRYTAGIGYRSGAFNIDFAYINTKYSLLPAKFFDYVTNYAYDTGYGPDTNPDIIPAGVEIASFNNINQTHNDHNFILTLSMRF